MFRQLVLGAAGAVICAYSAFAHVTLETREAPVGAGYKAVLRVPHGCEGTATTAIRVRVPEGFLDVKPMPKAGWQLLTFENDYLKSYNLRGTKLSRGVVEIYWYGGELFDAWYDEFVFVGLIAGELEAGKMLYFPVVQECEKGVHRWIEIPAEGKGPGDYPAPAPGLKLLPKR